MGTTGGAYDNAVAESLFSTLQRELLEQHQWANRCQLAVALFKWIKAWYNPLRQHTGIDHHSPIDHETVNTPAAITA